jgi:hypothetical protein
MQSECSCGAKLSMEGCVLVHTGSRGCQVTHACMLTGTLCLGVLTMHEPKLLETSIVATQEQQAMSADTTAQSIADRQHAQVGLSGMCA